MRPISYITGYQGETIYTNSVDGVQFQFQFQFPLYLLGHQFSKFESQ
jgi:hypothetical protein